MPESEIATSEASLRGVISDWDKLAVEVGRPFCAPSWALAWWRHLAPRDAALSVVLVRDSSALIGIAPLWIERGRLGLHICRPLSHRLAEQVGPIALPGREFDVSAAIIDALDQIVPSPNVLEIDGIDARSRLTRALGEGVPRVIHHRSADRPAPRVTVDGLTFEGWLDSRSSNFRHAVRKGRRRLAAKNLSLGVEADPPTIRSILDDFSELYLRRWGRKGGRFDASVVAMLRDVAAEMAPTGRFRMACVRAGAEPVGICLFVVAGKEVSLWRGAFDRTWQSLQPGLHAVLVGIEDACTSRVATVDLGAGTQAWKERLADDSVSLTRVSALLTPSTNLRFRLLQASDHVERGALEAARTVKRRLSNDARRT